MKSTTTILFLLVALFVEFSIASIVPEKGNNLRVRHEETTTPTDFIRPAMIDLKKRAATSENLLKNKAHKLASMVDLTGTKTEYGNYYWTDDANCKKSSTSYIAQSFTLNKCLKTITPQDDDFLSYAFHADINEETGGYTLLYSLFMDENCADTVGLFLYDQGNTCQDAVLFEKSSKTKAKGVVLHEGIGNYCPDSPLTPGDVYYHSVNIPYKVCVQLNTSSSAMLTSCYASGGTLYGKYKLYGNRQCGGKAKEENKVTALGSSACTDNGAIDWMSCEL